MRWVLVSGWMLVVGVDAFGHHVGEELNPDAHLDGSRENVTSCLLREEGSCASCCPGCDAAQNLCASTLPLLLTLYMETNVALLKFPWK